MPRIAVATTTSEPTEHQQNRSEVRVQSDCCLGGRRSDGANPRVQPLPHNPETVMFMFYTQTVSTMSVTPLEILYAARQGSLVYRRKVLFLWQTHVTVTKLSISQKQVDYMEPTCIHKHERYF